jgi:CRISPR/Cas system-associated exonuclease Cas4 (RecB family)
MSFLEQVARYLYSACGESLHRFCIVFPNIRAGLFFKRRLAELSGKPVWSPAFRSLPSLMEEITGLTKADSLSLIFELYQAYKAHKPTNESFEEFYFWGEMLLGDFDDVDKHLVDAQDLFRNISDLKDIDRIFDYLTEKQKNAIRIFWQDFNGRNSGVLKADFSNIWPLLYPVYETFKKRLKKKSLGYEGMIQREAVNAIRNKNAAGTFYDKFVFIGFNALNSCESYFFKSLQKQDRALFFWDYDDYYLSNLWHEAGTFMRDNIRHFPPAWNIDSHRLTHPDKNIEIISVPSDTGQAKMAGQILSSFCPSNTVGNTSGIYSTREPHSTPDKTWEQVSGEPDWQRVAVVLPDEHLLLPLLSSIPQEITDVNITMGYPFTCSPVNSLFEALVSLQLHIRNYSDGARFYYQDVSAILRHPCLRDIVPEKSDIFIKSIIEHNRIFIPEHEMPDGDFFKAVFRRCTKACDFVAYLSEIALKTAGKVKAASGKSALLPEETGTIPPESQYRLEYLYTFYTALQRIADILATEEIDMDIPVFSRLLRKTFASLKIPFSGEPLNGLQIMGMLETRALDFDRVIILSMNEGNYPKVNPRQSFIPYNLRKGFGLTTSDKQDATSAYHFYRLIQRAKDVRLLYNSAVTDRNTGEISRYLSQLIYEPAFNISRRNLTFHINRDKSKEIVKERSDEVKNVLNEYLKEGTEKQLSPSALNSYLDCRLRFYFRYIEGLSESREVTDEIDQSVFGSLLHRMMELLYQPYKDKEIDAEILSGILKNRRLIDHAILRSFADCFFRSENVKDEDITGRNIIIREVLLKYILRIIEIDKVAAPFTLVGLEDRMNIRVPIHNGKHSAMLNLTGFIDRLDYRRDTLYIIDYKTGNAKRSFMSISDLFDCDKPDNHAVMQTLMYAYMVRLAFPRYPRICSGLYVMKDLFTADYDSRIHLSRKSPIENYFDLSDEFESKLNSLFSEMFLSDTPFAQTDDTKKCLTCPYADICHRKHR